MRKYFVALVFLLFYVNQVYAISALLRQELKKLDPNTRLEQRCDIAAMEIIASLHKYAPDKTIAYSFAEPVINGNIIKAPGAAFRSHNNWYHLAFICTTTDDKLDIKSFTYNIGKIVPRSEWEHYYLVP